MKDLYHNSDDGPASFHAPRTLDQSYYLSLNQSGDRDKDQVVVKYVERQEEVERQGSAHDKRATVLNNVKPKKILMVNQMWVWKIDSCEYQDTRTAYLPGGLYLFDGQRLLSPRFPIVDTPADNLTSWFGSLRL